MHLMSKKYIASTSIGVNDVPHKELMVLGGWCFDDVQDTVGNCYQNEQICDPYGFLIDE